MDTSGRALIDHWSWAANKGVMNKNTAGSLRAACAQVLSIEEDPEAVDVSKLDIEEILRRWENLKKKDFKPESLETYKKRFRQAVSSYLSYLQDPGGWRPARERPAPAERNGGSRAKSKEPAITTAMLQPIEVQRGRVMDYPFPLREGLVARLTLPLDLTASEVRRLTAFMNTLVVTGESVS